jgi:hypothetical protein
MNVEPRATVRLSAGEIIREPEGPPRLEIELERGEYPADPGEIFLPLRLPDRVGLRLGGPLGRVVQGGRARLTVELAAGSHAIPLAAGEPCEIAVGKDARATVRLDAGAGLDPNGAVVRAFDLAFSPALEIRNLLHLLGQVHELATDRALGVVRPLLGSLPGLLQSAGGLALGALDETAIILLESVSLRPRWTGTPRLQAAFSGRIRWLNQLETRFDRVSLPTTILPALHASLERLLSRAPLATAELSGELGDPLGLARALLGVVRSGSGQISLDLDPPLLRVSSTTLDGAQLTGALRFAHRVRAQAELSLSVEGNAVSVSLPSVELSGDNRVTHARVDAAARFDLDRRPDAAAPDGATGPEDALDRALERTSLSLEVDVADGSRAPGLLLDLEARHGLCRGETAIPLETVGLSLSGGLSAEWDGHRLALRAARPLAVAASLRSPRPFSVRDAQRALDGELALDLEVRATPEPDGGWSARLRLGATAKSRVALEVDGIPELDITGGQIKGRVDGRISVEATPRVVLRQAGALDLDLAGTRTSTTLDRCELELEGRRLVVPPGTSILGTLLHGTISAAGPEAFALDLHWDMAGGECLLHHRGESVSLLTDDLRRGSVTLLLDRTGKLSFRGSQEGLYGARYFNALLNPAGDPEHAMALLRSDDALGRVIGALRVFNSDLAEGLSDLRLFLLSTRRLLEREGIREPGDFVPRAAIARILSLVLTGRRALVGRLEPIIQRVTEGHGLDIPAVREILHAELGDQDLDYEIGALLHWLDLVLSPSERIPPAQPVFEPPLALDPATAEARRGLPTAAELYEAVSAGPLSPQWSRRLADLAPSLTREQLAFVLKRAASFDEARDLARIRYVHEIKRRVADIAEGYGGAEYAPQASTISTFLGEAVGPLPGINLPPSRSSRRRTASETTWPPPASLGPEEVAALLQAGLATGKQNKRTQINNRLLLERMRREPPEFTRAVFVELGHQSPRALSGILYAFLDQDQDHMAEELDLVSLLEERLGLPVPRQRDHLAGGRRARESYYQALDDLAEAIIAGARPYLARKQHLQVQRHPVAPDLVIAAPVRAVEDRARESVERADALGRECRFEADKRGGPRQRARAAYERAFSACARLLAREPRAFQLPWLRAFWQRNEEALKVLSVVRAHQRDEDRVRRWISIRLGGEVPGGGADEQALLETVVRTLTFFEEDQRALLGDPLVRLLLDPPGGRYRFAIVSCMGVITEGEGGAELEDAYRRLEERRGLRILRAHTGTARTLEYNARQIIEAIASCETPYGLIGYSQGCANALMAESLLLGGTPDERRLLDGLVCRNLLFSAVNGSEHGTSGMLKFQRAMVLGEKYLKHYQALYSHEAVKAVLRIARALLDSRVFVAMLGGAHSISLERALDLHRDGQFLERVPTSHSRAVVTEDRVPETLELLYFALKEISGGVAQDTQVLLTDAVGYSTRMKNEHTRTLERCDMGSLAHATHHWAPLTKEIEFVTTERDRALAIYESPKDCLVWPWVEVNARFGRIERG